MRRTRRRLALVALAGAPLLVAACSKGAYQVEIFPEQHYQQSAKIQEPPRLEPPEGAVPITGREAPIDPEKVAGLKNPLPRNPQVLGRAAEVFRVNCAMCHGKQAAGDGPVGDSLVQYGYPRPPNLVAKGTQDRTDGDIFSIITNGILVMPQFRNMLSESDRWALVHYLRSLAEQQR